MNALTQSIETLEPQTVFEALKTHTQLSSAEIKEALYKGCVWLTQGKTQSKAERVRRAKRLLKPGQHITLYYNAKVLNESPLPIECVYSTEGYSVWFKPSGMRVYGSKWCDHTSLVRQVEIQLQQPIFVVHRLDQATSGLILVAHSKTMARIFSERFAQRTIHKTYECVVEGLFPDEPLTETSDIDGKNAITHFKKLSSDSGESHLQVNIETGRKHQIRIHAQRLGFPIVGDRLYNPKFHYENDLQLQAVQLSFQCPISGNDIDIKL